MKITIFTSNQPRHLHLIKSIAGIADEVFAIQECTTVFPGQIKDFFDNSQIMQDYFRHVREAEWRVFGNIDFMPGNVRQIALKSEDLNKLDMNIIHKALDSEFYIVFGASYIKKPLIDFLTAHKAINIHMGISPYYRGSSCNFWAPYQGHPELVGATIHLLSAGLDSGDILYHVLPRPQRVDPFVLGMMAVRAAHESLVESIQNHEIFKYKPISQDRSKEFLYTKNQEFTDEIVRQYWEKIYTPEQIEEKLENRDMQMFIHPYIG